MSRIGKQIITVPEKVDIKVEPGKVTVKGPGGEISRSFGGDIVITLSGKEVTFAPKENLTLESKALWGTYAAHVKNMIKGVETPFQKKLILEGVGYKADVSGTTLNLALGFSHPVKVAIPQGLKVTAEKGVVTISGIDRDLVGLFAAQIRDLKKPEPYKGKGFRYDTEVIRRKQGKKAA